MTARWFSLGTPVSSTNKSDHQDITEMLLKVALNTIKQTKYLVILRKHYSSLNGGFILLYFQESLKIGSSHNRSAKPFGGQSQYQPPKPEYQQQQQYREQPPQQRQQPPQQRQQQQPQYPQSYQQQAYHQQQQQTQPKSPTSPKTPVPTVVHAQFNSPIGLYSANKLAESYNIQTKGIQKDQLMGFNPCS
jgi:hypothetical protein